MIVHVNGDALIPPMNDGAVKVRLQSVAHCSSTASDDETGKLVQ